MIHLHEILEPDMEENQDVKEEQVTSSKHVASVVRDRFKTRLLKSCAMMKDCCADLLSLSLLYPCAPWVFWLIFFRYFIIIIHNTCNFKSFQLSNENKNVHFLTYSSNLQWFTLFLQLCLPFVQFHGISHVFTAIKSTLLTYNM